MTEQGQPADTITCVDCLGTAHLISVPPPDAAFEPGDFLVYRCADCNDRWDLVFEVEDDTRANGLENQ